MARSAQISTCLGQPLARFTSDATPQPGDVLVGWGQKANARQIKQQAQDLGLPYWQLEDGFIGYIGHPANGGKAVSLIADPVGIYYDARQLHIPVENEHLFRFKMNADSGLRVHRFRTPQSTYSDVR